MNSQSNTFSQAQKQYLQGVVMGADVARSLKSLPVLSGPNGRVAAAAGAVSSPRPVGPEVIHWEAQDRQIAAGKKLCSEEQVKRDKNALDLWDQMVQDAANARYPKGADVLLYKFHGLFYVAPAQDAFMCRLRFPGGDLRADQMRGLADLADAYAGGYADVTTRANLQLREISASNGVKLLMGLADLGILNQGAGADNIRNITASPLSGLDPDELIETLPLARRLHHHILHHRELYGLPRKFNIAFEGGGRIASLQDTNDIGFRAVRVEASAATSDVAAGVYFRLQLGGITGHRDFARDTGILLEPQETIPVADAIVRVFLMHGDRTDRKKARLKYLLDAWGLEKFIAETEKQLGRQLRRFDLSHCWTPAAENRMAHVGIHAQKQPGRHYVGLVLPVGRLTSGQMRGVADLAEALGSRTLRLTVWQNLLIPDIATDDLETVKQRIEALGLDWRADSLRAGLVACTGSAGCKYAAADTKRTAMAVANHLSGRLSLDQPINIHLTGCHHSCAQHYIGDIGLIAAKIESGEDLLDGFHIHVGGGWGDQAAIGRLAIESVPASDVPQVIEGMLRIYLENRREPEESFAAFTRRHNDAQLRGLFEPRMVQS